VLTVWPTSNDPHPILISVPILENRSVAITKWMVSWVVSKNRPVCSVGSGATYRQRLQLLIELSRFVQERAAGVWSMVQIDRTSSLVNEPNSIAIYVLPVQIRGKSSPSQEASNSSNTRLIRSRISRRSGAAAGYVSNSFLIRLLSMNLRLMYVPTPHELFVFHHG